MNSPGKPKKKNELRRAQLTSILQQGENFQRTLVNTLSHLKAYLQSNYDHQKDIDDWIENGLFSSICEGICNFDEAHDFAKTKEIIETIGRIIHYGINEKYCPNEETRFIRFFKLVEAINEGVYKRTPNSILIFIILLKTLFSDLGPVVIDYLITLSGINFLCDYYSSTFTNTAKRIIHHSRKGSANFQRNSFYGTQNLNFGTTPSNGQMDLERVDSPSTMSTVSSSSFLFSPHALISPSPGKNNLNNQQISKTGPGFNTRNVVPSLSLPLVQLQQKGAQNTTYTRSTRRINQHLNFLNLESLRLSLDTQRIQDDLASENFEKSDSNEKKSKAKQYFTMLAAKLGELYIAGDLTTLVSIKREIDKRPTSFSDLKMPLPSEKKLFLTEKQMSSNTLLSQTSFYSKNSKPISNPGQNNIFEEAEKDTISILKDFCSIISKQKSMQNLSAESQMSFAQFVSEFIVLLRKYILFLLLKLLINNTQARRKSRNPINVILAEFEALKTVSLDDIKKKSLFLSSASVIEQTDNQAAPNVTVHDRFCIYKSKLEGTLFQILEKYGEDVELRFFHLWKQVGGEKLDPTKDLSLKKYDLYLWRWNAITEEAIDRNDWLQINVQLQSLSTYLNSLTSRVHASQCSAVCLESFLSIQKKLVARVSTKKAQKSQILNETSMKSIVPSIEEYDPDEDNDNLPSGSENLNSEAEESYETVRNNNGNNNPNNANNGFFDHGFDEISSTTLHFLLNIFGYIISSPEHHPLIMEFFFFNLIDSKSNFDCIKEYSKYLLLSCSSKNESCEPLNTNKTSGSGDDMTIHPSVTTEEPVSQESRSGENEDNDIIAKHKIIFKDLSLERKRIQVLRHYQNLVELLQELGEEFFTSKVQQTMTSNNLRNVSSSINNGNEAADSNQTDSILKKLDFLVNPIDGLLLAFLTNSDNECIFTPNADPIFSVHLEVLKMLEKLFLLPNLPFLCQESYVNTYSRFHFLNFVKLYTHKACFPRLLEACTMHLKVLLALSRTKTDSVEKRFQLLKTVPFLAGEIDLEFEVESKNKKEKHLHNESSKSSQRTPQSAEEQNPKDVNSEGDSNTDDSETDFGTQNGSETDENESGDREEEETDMTGDISQNSGGQDEEDGLKNENQETKVDVSNSLDKENPEEDYDDEDEDENEDEGDRIEVNSDDSMTEKVVRKPSSNSLIPFLKFPSANDGNETATQNQGNDKLQFPVMALDKPAPPVRKPSVPNLKFALGGEANNGAGNGNNNSDSTTEKVATIEWQQKTVDLVSNNAEGSSGVNQSFVGTQETSIGEMNADGEQQGEETRLENDGTETAVSTDTDIWIDGNATKVNSENIIKFTFAQPVVVAKSQTTMNLVQNQNQQANDSKNVFFSPVSAVDTERRTRKIYEDDELHCQMIMLLISLLITRNQTLSPYYCDQFPHNKNMINVLFLLHCHLNDPSNDHMIPMLHREIVKMDSIGPKILLRLLCKKLFEPGLYSKKVSRIGLGAYGTVMRCELPFAQSEKDTKFVAVKLLELPKYIEDRCVLHDIFNEILIMETFKGDHRICRIYDYGVDDNFYYIIMKEYKCSLRTWRLKQLQNSLQVNMSLYMNIFKRILEAFLFLFEMRVNHFDVKSDNIFIEPFENVADEDFWEQKSEFPNFHLVIGDFGESMTYSRRGTFEEYTTRYRGTDCIKSPEMLKMEILNNPSSNLYDRRKKVGANSSSDVWSLGCLFFEIFSGEYLFDASEYVQFYTILTDENQTLISQERFSRINYNPILMDILTYILVRNPVRRPTIADIMVRFKYWMKMIPPMAVLKKNFPRKSNNISEDEKKDLLNQLTNQPKPQLMIQTPPDAKPDLPGSDSFEYIAYDLESPKQGLEGVNTKDQQNFVFDVPMTKYQQNLPLPSIESNTELTGKQKQRQNDDKIAESFLVNYNWNSEEFIDFYTENVSVILKNRLFVASDNVVGDKAKLDALGITHIVNCNVVKSALILAARSGKKSSLSHQQSSSSQISGQNSVQLQRNISGISDYSTTPVSETTPSNYRRRGLQIDFNSQNLSDNSNNFLKPTMSGFTNYSSNQQDDGDLSTEKDLGTESAADNPVSEVGNIEPDLDPDYNDNSSTLNKKYFYLKLKACATDEEMYNEYLDAFVFVRDAIKKRGKVLVHSGKGLSRAALFVVLYLMHGYAITSYESYLLTKTCRPVIRPEIITHFLHFLQNVKSYNSRTNCLFSSAITHTFSQFIDIASSRLISSASLMKISIPSSPLSSMRSSRGGPSGSSGMGLGQDPTSAHLSSVGSRSGANSGIHKNHMTHSREREENTTSWFRCLCGSCVIGLMGSDFTPKGGMSSSSLHGNGNNNNKTGASNNVVGNLNQNSPNSNESSGRDSILPSYYVHRLHKNTMVDDIEIIFNEKPSNSSNSSVNPSNNSSNASNSRISKNNSNLNMNNNNKLNLGNPLSCWPSYLDEMENLYFYDARYLDVAFVAQDSCLLSNFDVNQYTEYYQSTSPTVSGGKSKWWDLFRCKFCHSFTHAICHQSIQQQKGGVNYLISQLRGGVGPMVGSVGNSQHMNHDLEISGMDGHQNLMDGQDVMKNFQVCVNINLSESKEMIANQNQVQDLRSVFLFRSMNPR